MHLDRLLAGVEVHERRGQPFSEVEITDVSEDSRQVGPGTLFCCVTGEQQDGHRFAAAAVRAGASALLCERFVDVDVAQARVGTVRPAMAAAAAALYGAPSARLQVVGVTGTNGKTTVTHMLASIFAAAGRKTAVIGTLSGARTTPSAPELQRRLAAEVQAGTMAVAMEVSSHALVQGRVDSVSFAAAVFTNLSHDHLDYHGTMEGYFRAKQILFEPDRAAQSVINLDDAWGRRLAEETVGVVHGYSAQDASDLEMTLERASFTWRGRRLHLPMGGDFNVLNALAAATTAEALGVDADSVRRGLEELAPVRGRMQRIDAGQSFTLMVDFAHTPDGLERLLRSARQSMAPGGRLAVVFGCGGGRDAAKRPRMGSLASRLSDLAVITSDNPRMEDPGRIIEEILAGVDGTAARLVEPDRRAAIAAALDWARPGDVVLVAGKGHETGQEIAGVVHPFDDAEVARRLLAERQAS